MRRKFPGERVYHVLRWLKANKFSVPKATEQLSEHLAWQASALPIEPASVGPMMDKNIMSRIGQAVDGSAVLLITARNFPPPSPESIALVTQTALFQVLASLEALGGMSSPAAKLSVVYDRSGGVSTSQELVGLPSLLRFLSLRLIGWYFVFAGLRTAYRRSARGTLPRDARQGLSLPGWRRIPSRVERCEDDLR